MTKMEVNADFVVDETISEHSALQFPIPLHLLVVSVIVNYATQYTMQECIDK